MQFTVEEENLICMYHKSDRRRTAANILLPCRTWTRTWRRWPARPPTSWTPCTTPTLRHGSSISRTSNQSIAKRRARGLYGLCVRR